MTTLVKVLVFVAVIAVILILEVRRSRKRVKAQLARLDAFVLEFDKWQAIETVDPDDQPEAWTNE